MVSKSQFRCDIWGKIGLKFSLCAHVSLTFCLFHVFSFTMNKWLAVCDEKKIKLLSMESNLESRELLGFIFVESKNCLAFKRRTLSFGSS